MFAICVQYSPELAYYWHYSPHMQSAVSHTSVPTTWPDVLFRDQEPVERLVESGMREVIKICIVGEDVILGFLRAGRFLSSYRKHPVPMMMTDPRKSALLLIYCCWRRIYYEGEVVISRCIV